jgi:hypothetical protein
MVIAGITLLPAMIAQTSMRDRLLGKIVGDQQWSITTDSATFSWISPLQIEGVNLTSLDGTTRLIIDEVSADRTWWSLAASGDDLGEFEVLRPRLSVTATEPGDESQDSVDPSGLLQWSAQITDGSLLVRDLDPDGSDPIMNAAGIDVTIELVSGSQGASLVIRDWSALEREEISPELWSQGLKYLAPELDGELHIEGSVSLRFDELAVPVDAADDQLLTQMQVRGKAELHDLTAQLENPMTRRLVLMFAELLDLGPVPEKIRLTTGTEIEFAIQNGLTHHKSFTLVIPDLAEGFEFSSEGTVSMDEQLDLTITSRLPQVLLGEGSFARAVSETPLEIAVAGTIENPTFKLPESATWVAIVENELKSESLSDSDRELAAELSQLISELRDNN